MSCSRSLSEMWQVAWEHEYWTDDDAAAFDTEAEARDFAQRLALKGKRRIMVVGPVEEESS